MVTARAVSTLLVFIADNAAYPQSWRPATLSGGAETDPAAALLSGYVARQRL